MTTIITRLYAAEGKAVGAVEALKNRFSADEISVVTPKGGQKADIEALVAKTGVPRAAAAVYAEGVRKGGALVTVHAPWGFAKEVIKHLDSHGPIESGVATSEYSVLPGYHEASPFSEWLGWPVLEEFRSSVGLVDDPAPFSGAFRVETLLKSKSRTRLFNKAAPLSAILGLPTVSETKPFSTLVRNDKSHVTLVKGAAPFSSSFLIPVLWE
jgi:hypothetical protein